MFYLDGPDNLSSYHKQHPITCQRRQMKDGGIIVLGDDYSRWGNLVETNVLTGKHQQIMLESLMSLCNHSWIDISKSTKYFQQHNCSIHVSKAMTTWMEQYFDCVIPWPTRSPNLNIIENVDHKQYQSKEDLWRAMKSAGELLSSQHSHKIRNLYQTHNKWLLEVKDLKRRSYQILINYKKM